MSAVQQVACLPQAVDLVGVKPEFVSAAGAAVIAGRHPETIRQAAREGDLHGTQREGVNPRTHKPFRGAQWRFRPACVVAWVEGEPCEHQKQMLAPVSMGEYGSRKVSKR